MLGITHNAGYSDPYPIIVPGVDKPILSYKVEDFINADFWHYYGIYKMIKTGGFPYDGVFNNPPWVLQLTNAFDGVIEAEKRRADQKFLAKLHGYKVM